MAGLALVLLASLGALVVDVDGPADEVVAFRDGVLRASAPVRDGRAVLEGLREGPWDLQARGAGHASELLPGVRAVPGPRDAADARLTTRPAHPVEVEARPGSTAWVGGVALDAAWNRVPGGLQRLIVDHPAQVSTPARLLRVAGPLRVEAGQEAGLVVTGTVQDAAGGPIPGARVRVFTDGVPASREAETDAQGRFGVSGFYGDVIAIEVSALGRATALHRVEFFPGEERARAEVVLRPGSAVTVSASGRGAPLLDAEAILLPEWVTFALDEPRLRASHLPARRRGGRALRFPGLTPGRRYRLLVSAPGFLPVETAPFEAPDAGRTLALGPVALPEAAALPGRLDGPAAEAAGHTVLCAGAGGTARARTDRHGAFRFEGLAAGQYALTVVDVVAGTWEGTLPVPSGGAAVLPVPGDGSGDDLACLVVDADEQPLPGARVEALGRSATTDAEGRATLAGIPASAGKIRVVASPGPDCRALADDPHLPQAEEWSGGGGPLRLRLARAGRMRLRFVDLPAPLGRATLRLAGSQGHHRTLRLPRGAEGATIEDLPAGSWAVDLVAPRLLGTEGALVEAVPGDGEPVDVRVVAGREVRGTLVRRSSGSEPGRAPEVVDEPVEQGRVTLFDPDPRRSMATTPVEADGSFVLEGLPPGPVLLAAWTPGRPVDVVRVDLTGGDVAGLTIALREASEVRVLATGPSGRPLPGAHAVRTVHDTGADRADLSAVGAYRRVVADDLDTVRLSLDFAVAQGAPGWVRVPFLAPGSWEVYVAAPGYRPGHVGVRAPLPDTLAELRRLFPDLPVDLWPRLRLEPDSGGAKD